MKDDANVVQCQIKESNNISNKLTYSVIKIFKYNKRATNI